MMPMKKTGRLVLCSLVMQGSNGVSALEAPPENPEPVRLELQKGALTTGAGDYQLGEFSGFWQRTATGDGLRDGIAAFDGQVRFTLQDPAIEGQLEISCNLREAILDITEFPGGSPAYGCDFLVNGRTFPARFELQQASGDGAMQGAIALDRVIPELLKMTVQGEAPLFLFTWEGRRLGLASFDGTTTVQFYAEADLAVRRAVVTTVLALELLRQE